MKVILPAQRNCQEHKLTSVTVYATLQEGLISGEGQRCELCGEVTITAADERPKVLPFEQRAAVA